MLHSPEDTLNAYREVADFTMDAVQDEINKLGERLIESQDDFEVARLQKEIKDFENCLYIIGNDD